MPWVVNDLDRSRAAQIRTQLLTMKRKTQLKKARIGLPIIHMPRRRPQRYIRWDRIFILASAIAWWVGIIWIIIQHKGGEP